MTDLSTAPAPAPSEFLPAPVRAVAPYFLLLLAVFGVYGNIYDNVFLFDDDLLIRMNVNIKDWQHIGDILTGSTTSGAHIAGGFFRPLQMLLYLVAYHIGGGSELPFHLLNVGLHAANACLVYRLGVKLGFGRMAVFLAALLWAVHPLHTEAVTYISATADPLFALFCLLSVDYLLPDFSMRKIWRVMPLFLLGLVSKETTVMLPLLVMCCLFYTQPDRLNWRLYVRTWPLWVITVLFALWRMNAGGFDGPQTYARLYDMHSFAALKSYAENPWYRLCTFFATIPAYFSLLAWPHDLHMERSFSIYTTLWVVPVIVGALVSLCAAVTFIANVCGVAVLGPLVWGLLWLFAAHAPDSGLLVPMNSLFLEHWMYLPSVGLFLGLAETLRRLLQPRARFLSFACVALVLFFTGLMVNKTYAQNRLWKQPDVFYNNIFDHGEKSARARNNLALYYSDKGELKKAIEQFRAAVAVSDTYAETHHNMALTYLRLGPQGGNLYIAIAELQRAVEIDANFYRSWQVLGELYGLTGQPGMADAARERYRALAPKP